MDLDWTPKSMLFCAYLFNLIQGLSNLKFVALVAANFLTIVFQNNCFQRSFGGTETYTNI